MNIDHQAISFEISIAQQAKLLIIPREWEWFKFMEFL